MSSCLCGRLLFVVSQLSVVQVLNEMIALDQLRMAHQQQRLVKESTSAATVKVMTESTLANTRQKCYKGTQAMDSSLLQKFD
ncbi:hypothetical protein MVEG_06888 [Podila verticillata NRRL 6337]|nr:hypothetical protein MVEG_06888 [Podila verticillata NRRL 6337]